jgi:hypothetical protein
VTEQLDLALFFPPRAGCAAPDLGLIVHPFYPRRHPEVLAGFGEPRRMEE